MIRKCYKVTHKLRYLPCICHVAWNSSINIQPWKLQKTSNFTPVYMPTLIHYACHEIFTLIKWSYKATPKLRYLPSICHAASNSIIDIQLEKATKQLQIHTCLHAHLYLYVPYFKQICQSLPFQYTNMYFNETYSFWTYHAYSTNLQTYKHTTYSIWLAW